jgi:hypothetical protein
MDIFCLECPSKLLTAAMKWAALWAGPPVHPEPCFSVIAGPVLYLTCVKMSRETQIGAIGVDVK